MILDYGLLHLGVVAVPLRILTALLNEEFPEVVIQEHALPLMVDCLGWVEYSCRLLWMELGAIEWIVVVGPGGLHGSYENTPIRHI
jgi:hypothetical protein